MGKFCLVGAQVNGNFVSAQDFYGGQSVINHNVWLATGKTSLRHRKYDFNGVSWLEPGARYGGGPWNLRSIVCAPIPGARFRFVITVISTFSIFVDKSSVETGAADFFS